MSETCMQSERQMCLMCAPKTFGASTQCKQSSHTLALRRGLLVTSVEGSGAVKGSGAKRFMALLYKITALLRSPRRDTSIGAALTRQASVLCSGCDFSKVLSFVIGLIQVSRVVGSGLVYKAAFPWATGRGWPREDVGRLAKSPCCCKIRTDNSRMKHSNNSNVLRITTKSNYGLQFQFFRRRHRYVL